VIDPLKNPMGYAVELTTKRAMFADTLLSTIDWAALRRQKKTLIGVRKTIARRKQQLDDLSGIIQLLDHIQDRAAEVIGDKEVFGDEGT